MNGINILLLFMGWLLYWFTTTANHFKANPGNLGNRTAWRAFLLDKLPDFFMSLFVCGFLIIIGPEIPPTWIDLSGKLSVIGAGYGSVSLANKLLPLLKRTV